MQRDGIASEGTVKFAFGSIVFLFGLMALSVLRADDVATSPAIQVLMQKLDAACHARDLAAIKACYDTEGIPAETVDISLSTWQEYFNANGNDTHWTYYKAAFQTVDAVRHENGHFMCLDDKPRLMGEHLYQANLRLIGFITVQFKMTGGETIGAMEPVGIGPDGVARLSMDRRVN